MIKKKKEKQPFAGKELNVEKTLTGDLKMKEDLKILRFQSKTVQTLARHHIINIQNPDF